MNGVAEENDKRRSSNNLTIDDLDLEYLSFKVHTIIFYFPYNKAISITLELHFITTACSRGWYVNERLIMCIG